MKKDPLKLERLAMAALARGDKDEAARIVEVMRKEDYEATQRDMAKFR